jgi:amidase
MKKPTARNAALSAEAQIKLALDNTPMSDIIDSLASRRVTATALSNSYLARIQAYDRDGPKFITSTSSTRCCLLAA